MRPICKMAFSMEILKNIENEHFFRRNQPSKIASLERHSKLNTQTLQGSCLKMLCTQPVNSNLLIEVASLNCSVCLIFLFEEFSFQKTTYTYFCNLPLNLSVDT